MYYILILAVVLLDQLTKWLVRARLPVGDSVPLINGALRLTHLENSGAAFSSLEGQRLLLTLLPIALIIVFFFFLVRVHSKAGTHFSARLADALIIAGGIGNLTDRLIFGSVTDFIDIIVWPIFNVADISVCVGCGFLVLYVLFFDREKKG